MFVQSYAKVLGAVLLVVGLVGLVLGDQPLLGILNIDVFEDLVHLVTGGLLLYAGFGRRDAGLARVFVAALGAIYLVVGLAGFAAPMLFGLLPHGYGVFDNLLHLTVGVVSLAVAFYRPTGATAAGAR